MDNQQNDLSPIKRALLEIRELRAKLAETEQAKAEPIAIIGLGMRFPGQADSPEKFWQLLRDGVDAITETPAERWDVDAYYDPDPTAPGKMTTRGGGFLADVDRFDAHFFGISPREAISMDPQQRMLLEVSWEALEHAGQSPDKLSGTQTGVFIGISSSDYFRRAFPNPANTELYPITGNAFSVAAGRLSYTLGLQGPCLALDTACSSSLTAVHIACQSLRSGESNLALVGGVNLMLSPDVTLSFAKSQMMAVDDHCKTFDAEADGYVRSEGCGVVVLKRLSDALANGDNILALIRGSAVNQDGRSSGLTAPNGPAQEAVIRRAIKNANVAPNQISYVETHGTGTPLGDPIEVQALAAVLGQDRTPDKPLLIGSVKTNMGHLEAAAGIAGLIKVVLSLHHQQIPPHLNMHQPNPYIPWDEIPVEVATELIPWPADNERRLAGVSSFGFSGTNAHVILEAAPAAKVAASEEEVPERSYHLLTLSARRDDSLRELASRYEQFLDKTKFPYPDICFTTNDGRAHLNHRLAVVAQSAAEARQKLAAFVANQEIEGIVSGQVNNLTQPEVVFMFTGHGAQYIHMGQMLFESQPEFRATIEQCAELLGPHLDRSLLDVLFPAAPDAGLMDKMAYAQPALFAVEYALAALWRSWGIEPTAVMGHSVGEYVAACIAGVFSLADGLKLVAARGRLMDSLPETGEMVSLLADEAMVTKMIAPYRNQLAIAAINGPQSVVISGAREAIDTVMTELQAKEVKTRRLNVAQAGHSPLLDPILAEFEQIAAEIAYSAPRIDLISGLTGQLASQTELTSAKYWRRHLREPVQFAACMATLREQGYHIFVEIGPHPTLLGMGRRCWPELEPEGLWLPSLRQNWDDWLQMLESLAALYSVGVPIDWPGFERTYVRRHIPLPTYPWADQRYWLEATASQPAPAAATLWDVALTAGSRQAQQAPLDLAVATYPARWQALEQLTIAYTIQTLQALACFNQPGERYTIESLLAKSGILPSYYGLLQRWLKRLVKVGLLQLEAEEYTAKQPLPEPLLAEAWDKARQLMPDTPQLLAYLERCGANLAAILTGQESPLETLFPGGAFDTTEFLYHHWAPSRYFNGIVQAIVANISAGQPPDKTLRVIEIGAGTGGTSAAIMPILPANRSFYQYTDVSDLFLSRAEEKFKEYPFVRYGLLNAETDPQAQNYKLHSFDIVIAANVLHATRNLHDTLTNVRSLLAPGGLLLLFEATDHLAWFDITTGLIEGWGRFEDELRQDNPLLSPAQWAEILQSSGFEQVVALPQAESPAKILGQHVIVAQAPTDGVAAISDGLDMGFQHYDGQTSQGDGTAAAGQPSSIEMWRSQLSEALADERREMLIEFTRGHVSRILRLPPTPPLGRKERLLDMGFDSLMAVELRNRLTTGLGLSQPLSATLVFDYPTIEAIAGYLEKMVVTPDETVMSDEVSAGPIQNQAATASSSSIVDLSDEEVEAMLLKKLENL